MVKIIDYRKIQKEDGTEFFALEVQGGIEAVKSKESNRVYLTAKTARIPCTFNETTCQTLIGSELPGVISKVEVAPYEYIVPDTDEVITLMHRYEYVDSESEVIQQNVTPKEVVL